MNITEANAVNVLVDHAFKVEHQFERPELTEAAVRAAAVILIRGAHKALSAGSRPEQIEVAPLRPTIETLVAQALVELAA